MKKLVAAVVLATTFACGPELASAPPLAQRDSQGLSLSAGDASVRYATEGQTVTARYFEAGRQVGTLAATPEGVTITAGDVSRQFAIDPSAAPDDVTLVAELGSGHEAAVAPLQRVLSTLRAHQAEFSDQLKAGHHAAGTSEQALECTSQCCMYWQAASDAYIAGRTWVGAYYEYKASQAC